jgi:protein-tyrosine-phosphatase
MASADEIPSAVLFACTQNAIRSPIAAALMRHFYGNSVFVASVGVRSGEADPFVGVVMDEIGIDMARHKPQSFEDLEDANFDLVVSLSPEAHHRALEMTRTMAIEAEYWPTQDPSAVSGSREQMLAAYREVRDGLTGKIRKRFGTRGAPGV